MSSESKLVVIVPNLAMGHLPSTIEFAKLLVKQDQRFSILIVILHNPIFSSSNTIDAYIQSKSREPDLNCITFFTLPRLLHNNDSTISNFNTIIDQQKPLVKKVVEDRGSKPVAFILDMVCIDVATQLDVPSYIYFTSGANFLSLLFHVQSLADDEGIDVIFTEFDDPNTELDIPEFKNPVPVKVLPWYGVDKQSIWLKMVLNMPRRFREAKGILVNTFIGLESYVIRSLVDHHKSKIVKNYVI